MSSESTPGSPERLVGAKGKRGPYTPTEKLMKAYDLVIQLRQQGLTYKQIINEVEKTLGIKITKSHCSFWCRRIHSPYNRLYIGAIEFLRPSEDLAYLIGVHAGDAYVTGEQFFLRLEVKDKDFADAYSISLSRVLGRYPPEPRPNKDGKWVVVVASKVLYQLLRKPIDIDRIRPFVEHCERCVAMFLRGFFDSEGSVSKLGTITVYNTDYQLLVYVIYLLKKLGIETTSYAPKTKQLAGGPFRNPRTGKTYHYNKDYYYLRIRRSSNESYYNLVGFSIERKKQRLEEYLRRQRRRLPAT
ncbi:conserved hypothetical protein [Candidatus Caldarchaeum subterraneum]|uniref:Intein/rRNA intron-related DNA endonuclease n=1 Tax=Caldiarchaeum subterraneum TaxID=311458 RepID=E6N2P5_CALS0|nr:intein/rRNA intron-related DNA endonuclease [Candidatus Caldarchaeum subterraneum]BAJ50585.1 conserved hypothetical protein [Candidatus Caldarchaeum subterraneum]